MQERSHRKTEVPYVVEYPSGCKIPPVHPQGLTLLMLGKEGGERKRPEAKLYEYERSHSWDISPELQLGEGKKVKIKKPKSTTPSPGCCTIYKLNSEERGQTSLGFLPQISALAQQRNAFGLQEHSSHHQEDKALPSPPDSLAERRHMGFNCIQDTNKIRAFVPLQAHPTNQDPAL